jgi:hypothetical protein
MISQRIAIALISLVLIWFVIVLIRRKKLKVEYSILWLAMGAVIILVSLWPAMIDVFVEALGIYYLTFIYLVSFSFVLIMLVHFTTIISRLSEREMILAQKQALLEWKLKKLMEGAEKG